MIGDAIKKYRKNLNMSQDELAEKLDVTRQSVSLWETGQTQPSLDYVVALAGLFGVTTDDLLREEGSGAPASSGSGKSSHRGRHAALIALLFVFALAAEAVLFLFFLKPEAPTEPSKPVSSVAEEPVPSSSSEEPAPAQSTAEEPKDVNFFDFFKGFIIKNGRLNGDYCVFSHTADVYGGEPEDNYNLFYWGDTDKVELSYHHVMDDDYSISYMLYIPKINTGTYEYIISYYLRATGENEIYAQGTVNASDFTLNYPLNCSRYIGNESVRNDFMEVGRVGVCRNLWCLAHFLVTEKTGYTLEDLGFVKFLEG